MDAAGIFSGLMMLLTGVGATIVLVIQAKSATRIAERIAEVKARVEETHVVAVEAKAVTEHVQTLTNSAASEQRTLITKQVDQIEAMRRDAVDAQTRCATEVAALVMQIVDMKTLVAQLLPAATAVLPKAVLPPCDENEVKKP